MKKKSQLPVNISEITPTKLSSLLEQDATRINELLEIGDSDNAITLIYKRLAQSCVDAIPLLEDNIRTSKGARGTYQFNTMVTTLRELLVDLQAISARGQIGVAVVDKVIRPFILDLGMLIVQELKNIEEDGRSFMTKENYDRFRAQVVKSRDNIADFVNRRFVEVKKEAQDLLQR